MDEYNIWAKGILKSMEDRGLNIGRIGDNVTCISEDYRHIKGRINLVDAYADNLFPDEIFAILNGEA